MNRLACLAAAALGSGALSGLAQLTPPPDDSFANRVGISYRPGFNITARFSGLGGFAAQTDPGPATGGALNRNYDDGFNRLDSAGNIGGLTWNWGYRGVPGQLPGNDTIVMHSSSVPATVEAESSDEGPQHGFEFTYNRQLGSLGKCPWGVEAAFNWTAVRIRDSGALPANVLRTSDAYALGGITPPLAPYAGSFNVPAALISDSPTRTSTLLPFATELTGQRSIEASVYGGRLGPYLQLPIFQRFSLSLSGGLALALVDSEFKFSESVTLPGAATASHSGSASDSDVLWGGYFAGTFAYAVTERASVFAGVQYQNVGTFTQAAAGKHAELNLTRSFFATIGVGYSF